MLGNIKKRMENKRVNKLASMKAKTRSLREKKKQYNAEAKIERAYNAEKKAAFNRSAAGKVKSFLKKEIKAKQKRNKSSGLFAEEGKSMYKRTKKKGTNSSSLFDDDNDTFKKWGF